MIVDFESLTGSQTYHLMTQAILPRPIAWVLTDSGAASYNLAPFSYFNAVCSEPPIVMISAGSKRPGEVKDTRRNIVERKSLVIHIPQVSQAKLVSESAASLEHGDSEVERLGLELVEEPGWSLPRLAISPIAMLAHFYELQEIGPHKQALILCQLDRIYMSDDVVSLDEKQRVQVDPQAVDPLSRLGGNSYASIGDNFTFTRLA